MKILAMTLIFWMGVNTYASTFQARCSNPEATVIYSVNDLNQKLLASKLHEDGQVEKIELENYSIQSIRTALLESSESNSCDSEALDEGVLDKNELQFKRIKISLDQDRLFDPQVIGVSKDLKFLQVDYLCQSKYSTAVTCK